MTLTGKQQLILDILLLAERDLYRQDIHERANGMFAAGELVRLLGELESLGLITRRTPLTAYAILPSARRADLTILSRRYVRYSKNLRWREIRLNSIPIIVPPKYGEILDALWRAKGDTEIVEWLKEHAVSVSDGYDAQGGHAFNGTHAHVSVLALDMFVAKDAPDLFRTAMQEKLRSAMPATNEWSTVTVNAIPAEDNSATEVK